MLILAPQVYAKIADMREWQSWLDKDPKAKSHTHGLLSSGDGFHYTVGPNRVDATVIQAHPGQVCNSEPLVGFDKRELSRQCYACQGLERCVCIHLAVIGTCGKVPAHD